MNDPRFYVGEDGKQYWVSTAEMNKHANRIYMKGAMSYCDSLSAKDLMELYKPGSKNNG